MGILTSPGIIGHVLFPEISKSDSLIHDQDRLYHKLTLEYSSFSTWRRKRSRGLRTCNHAVSCRLRMYRVSISVYTCPLHIYALLLGIGGQVDRDELAAMASKPTEKFMSMIDSFDVLDEIKEQLAIKACEGK